MVPSHHDCSSTQATVSAPSSASVSIGVKSPSDLNVPRQSW